MNRAKITGVAFVAAPALLLVDNLLHPKEYEPGNEAEQLRVIADSYERWQIAHMLAFAAILIIAVGILGLASMLYERRPRAALWGGALGLAGLFGFASALTLDGFTWGILGEVSGRPGVDQRTVQLSLDEIQNSAWSLPYYLTAIGYILGLLILAVGAARGELISPLAAGLLVVAVVMTGTETMIVSNAYFIAGSVVLLVAGVAVALSLWRVPESAPVWTSS